MDIQYYVENSRRPWAENSWVVAIKTAIDCMINSLDEKNRQAILAIFEEYDSFNK